MKRITKISVAIMLITVFVMMTPAETSIAATRNLHCPSCGASVYTSTLIVWYPNAWNGGHRRQWHYEYTCANPVESHKWYGGEGFADEPHSLNGNTCTQCGYVVH